MTALHPIEQAFAKIKHLIPRHNQVTKAGIRVFSDPLGSSFRPSPVRLSVEQFILTSQAAHKSRRTCAAMRSPSCLLGKKH